MTKDVSAYTKAAVFQPGTKTDTLIRFSTVADGKNNILENHFKPQSGEHYIHSTTVDKIKQR